MLPVEPLFFDPGTLLVFAVLSPAGADWRGKKESEE